MQQQYFIRRSSLIGSSVPGGKPRLNQLDIELTERCNNACQHCYINLPALDANSRSRELSTVEWQTILRQAADLGALTVRITGGEPLLREDFADLYLFARRIGLRVKLFTNARLITRELVDLFARVPPREKIEITVYGMRAESYDAVTCAPGSFFEFQRGINLLLNRQIPFLVKSAVLPANRAEIEEFEAWAAALPGMEELPEYAMFFDLRGRRDSMARNQQIMRLRVAAEEGVALLCRHEQQYRQEMHCFCSRFIKPAGAVLFDCGAGHGGCVDAYGRFQPCMLLRDPDLSYDLRTGSISEALEYFFPRLWEMKATNPAYLERCARCFLHGLCEQCPAKSWSEHGTLDTPVEYLCQIAHAQACFLGLLETGEKAWEVENWQARVNRLKNQGGNG